MEHKTKERYKKRSKSSATDKREGLRVINSFTRAGNDDSNISAEAGQEQSNENYIVRTAYD